MSRIGKLPIKIPDGVLVNVKKNAVSISGQYGNLECLIPVGLSIKTVGSVLLVKVNNNLTKTRALQGLYRTLLQNMVYGVCQQFIIDLQLNGVGYRCQTENSNLILSLGFSHPINLAIPVGIEVQIEANTNIKISGPDKEKVGFFASKLRDFRPPEPYNGKGVLYKDEIIIRKAGKVGKK
jgi:large subunit ribosomal protein L6